MVIQRWQSVLLLVAAAMMGCFTFCSLGQIQTEDFTYNFTSLGFFQEGETTGGVDINYPTWYLFALSLTTTVLFLIDIFLFKNSGLQKRVCMVGVLFSLASAATAGCLGYAAVAGGVTGWSAVAICPFIAVVAAILAYWRISRDENLLRAADRIR